MPANVFLRFFIVSSVSPSSFSSPLAAADVELALVSLPFLRRLSSAERLTVELALLTPLTVLDSDAAGGEIEINLQSLSHPHKISHTLNIHAVFF